MTNRRTAPTPGDAARAALDSHPTLDVHGGAVEALAQRIDALAKADPPDEPLTVERMREALDELGPWLNARRRDPIRSLGAYLGSTHRSARACDVTARGWLELATGRTPSPIEEPSAPNGAPAHAPTSEPGSTSTPLRLAVRELEPSANLEATVGRHSLHIHDLGLAIEAVLDLLDAGNRAEADGIAKARALLRRVERTRPPFVA